MTLGHPTTCGFVPPYLIERLDRPEWLDHDQRARAARAETAGVLAPVAAAAPWEVHDAAGGTALPGARVRGPADPATGDPAADEAADGVAAALAMYSEVYRRDSFDDAGAAVLASVHYSRDYANAFWDGTQLVFGDGDGEVFDRFTKPVDVLGHELTHAVTEHTAGLVYQGQSGALNESMSDVFASCLKQRLLGQAADEADWLIGQGIFLPRVKARALRDMAAPGTAYDDPRLGRDPQPDHMDRYVETSDDNGGVHLNSGIPNRAFQLAAVGIGGSTWEGAGRVWYAALTGPDVGAHTDFAGFAAACVAAAGPHADAVRSAWETVGVAPAAGSAAPTPAGGASTGVVRVRRTGGFAGVVAEADLDLAGDDPRVPEVAGLVARVDPAALPDEAPQPDRFVYEVQTPTCHVRVPEQRLTSDLRRLVDLLLG